MSSWAAKKLKKLRGTPAFETESLMLEITELIVACMVERGITRSELASKVNKDRSQITRFLNGNANTTIKTLVEIATALDMRWNLGLEKVETGVQYVDFKSLGSNSKPISPTNTVYLHQGQQQGRTPFFGGFMGFSSETATTNDRKNLEYEYA